MKNRILYKPLSIVLSVIILICTAMGLITAVARDDKPVANSTVVQTTAISGLTAEPKGFSVKWKRQPFRASGYQIKYSTNRDFNSARIKTVSDSKKSSEKITGLKGKRRYYVRVRTYKAEDGKNYYSSWSEAKIVTTEK